MGLFLLDLLFIWYSEQVGNGFKFQEISYKELVDIQALNQWMHVYAAELAMNGAISFNIEELCVHLENQLMASCEDNYIDYMKHTIYFGRSIIKATDNETMLEVYDAYRSKTMRMAIVNWKIYPDEKHYSANEINTNIYEAIVKKSYEKIKKYYEASMAYSKERFVRDGRLV